MKTGTIRGEVRVGDGQWALGSANKQKGGGG